MNRFIFFGMFTKLNLQETDFPYEIVKCGPLAASNCLSIFSRKIWHHEDLAQEASGLRGKVWRNTWGRR